MLRPPQGSLAVAAHLDLAGPLRWQATARGGGIDAAAAWRGAPPAQVHLDLAGEGVGARAGLRLHALRLTAPAGTVHLDGHGVVDGGALREIDARLELAVPALSRLAELGLPRLGGSLSARARVHGRGALQVEAALDGAGLRAGGVRLDGLALALAATPRLRDGRLWEVQATLTRLRAATSGVVIAVPRPAAFHLREALSVLSIAGLELASSAAHLRLDGRYDMRRQAADLRVGVNGLDLAEVARLAAPGQAVPHTRLEAQAHLRGPLRAPKIDLEVQGPSEPLAGLPRLLHRLRAHLAGGRLTGELDTGGGPSLQARFDVPLAAPARGELDLHLAGVDLALLRRQVPSLPADLAGEARLDLGYRGGDLDARLATRLTGAGDLELTAQAHLPAVPALAAALPGVPVSAELRLSRLDLARLPLGALGLPVRAGLLGGTVRVSGTARDPALLLDLTLNGLRTPAAGGLLDNMDAALHLAWRDGAAAVDAALTQAGRKLLTLRGTTQLAPGTLLLGDAVASLRQAPLHLDVALPGYDLSRLGAVAGTCAGSLAARGTLAAPRLSLDLALTGLRAGDLGLGTVTVAGSGGLKQRVVGAVAGLLIGELRRQLGGYLPIEVIMLDLGYQGYRADPQARFQPRLDRSLPGLGAATA